MKKKIFKKIIDNRGFILTVVLLFCIRWSFADHYRVPSGSMIPTIQIGDHLLVNKMAYDLKVPFTNFSLIRTGTPERGDIIVFEYPHNTSTNYVKRLVGLPGDKLEIVDGFLKVNGVLTLKSSDELKRLFDQLKTNKNFYYQEVMNKKVITIKRTPNKFHPHQMKITVPENHYFFMGDNRDNSADSRYWGFVHRDRLMGKVKNITFSLTFDGIIPNPKFKRFGRTII